MSLKSYLTALFPKPSLYTDKRKKELEKRLVSTYAQGNASLQLGNYITKKEIEEQKAKLKNYRF